MLATPFLYFSEHDDPGLAATAAAGRRRAFAAFGWRPEDVADPQHPDTFARSVLRWDETAAPAHAALLAWYRDLITQRHAHPALAAGSLDDTEVAYDEQADWLVAHGRAAGITAAVNFGPTARRLPAPGTVVLAAPGVTPTPDGPLVPPDGVAIVATGPPDPRSVSRGPTCGRRPAPPGRGRRSRRRHGRRASST